MEFIDAVQTFQKSSSMITIVTYRKHSTRRRMDFSKMFSFQWMSFTSTVSMPLVTNTVLGIATQPSLRISLTMESGCSTHLQLNK